MRYGLGDLANRIQAPAEQICVTDRQEEAGAGKGWRRADEGVKFAVALAMSKNRLSRSRFLCWTPGRR